MDTQMTNETLRRPSKESITLAKQARRELERDLTTSVLCPMCKTHPTLTVTPGGERSKVKCKCGYIYSSEIYF